MWTFRLFTRSPGYVIKENASDFLNRSAEGSDKHILNIRLTAGISVMGALNRADDEIEHVHVRHEEKYAFIACVHARFTVEAAVCVATSGSGRARFIY